MSLDFSELLLAVVKNKASDLHITAGSPPMLRVRGSLVPIDGQPSLTPTDTREFIYAILNSSQRPRLETDGHRRPVDLGEEVVRQEHVHVRGNHPAQRIVGAIAIGGDYLIGRISTIELIAYLRN